MSHKSTLSELAAFVAKSPLASDNEAERQEAMRAIGQNLMPKPAHRKVTDLLGSVLVLSARTRRMVQPKTGIDLDVFSPQSKRAVKVTMSAARD